MNKVALLSSKQLLSFQKLFKHGSPAPVSCSIYLDKYSLRPIFPFWEVPKFLLSFRNQKKWVDFHKLTLTND